MATRVKICGLTRREDVRAADSAGADFLGFVMAPSRRRIAPERAREIADGVRAARVAVTVGATPAELDRIVEIFAPDFIQFHGSESPHHVLSEGARLGVRTIKAVGVAEPADLRLAETYAACDLVLYDAKPPKGARVQGGHGAAFDWGLLTAAPRPRVWALAGGLTPCNVADAVARTGAPMVDTASGVESAPGLKDAGLIRAFIAAARG